jgi:hypothetical protein
MGECMYGSSYSWPPPGEKASGTHCIGDWVTPGTGLNDVEKRKFSPLQGLKLQTLCRLARSQLLHRLRNPGGRMINGWLTEKNVRKRLQPTSRYYAGIVHEGSSKTTKSFSQDVPAPVEIQNGNLPNEIEKRIRSVEIVLTKKIGTSFALVTYRTREKELGVSR